MERIVVVGAGQAGASLVAKFRPLGHVGPITLIGDEPVFPYERPPSPKGCLGELEPSRLYLRPASFYTENKIEILTGVTVDVSIRREGGDRRRAADRLRQACPNHWIGSAAVPTAIGGELEGIHVVRALAGVDAMAPAFVEGARALVVGGGYIGLEAAAVAAKSGMKLTLIEMADRILQRVASVETSDHPHPA